MLDVLPLILKYNTTSENVSILLYFGTTMIFLLWRSEFNTHEKCQIDSTGNEKHSVLSREEPE